MTAVYPPRVGLRVMVMKILVSLLLLALGARALAAAPPFPDELAADLDELFTSGALTVHGVPILTGTLLARFYAQRDHRPAWSDPAKVDQLLTLLASAESDGLDPEDYNLSLLRSIATATVGGREPVSVAQREILYTESLIRFAYHQRFGKVDPTTFTSSWNFFEEIALRVDPAVTLNEAVESASLADYVAERIPRGPLYRQVQQALQRYRAIAAAGGWQQVASGNTLRTGDRDPRVGELRQRLVVSADLGESTGDGDPQLFDDALAEAVRRFQERHSLDVDGAVGPGTLEALNVPVAVRIDQLRMSLERARWVTSVLDPSFVLVNIAAAKVYVVRNGERVWQRRAMVGKTYRQTPIFRGLMTYLEINPTWTVPPGILRNDILPKLRVDPGYLARSNMVVLDRSGRKVDAGSVDWKSLRGMPYTIRQEPGPDNSLGRIKFMFPNEHFVFLHDTPNRALFAASVRTFSSGCIRVEDPFSLASVLLQNDPKWNDSAVSAVVDSGKTRRVSLAQPWPVYILYWTAEAEEDGTVHFYRDVYGRDPTLLRGLDAEVAIDHERLAGGDAGS